MILDSMGLTDDERSLVDAFQGTLSWLVYCLPGRRDLGLWARWGGGFWDVINAKTMDTLLIYMAGIEQQMGQRA